MTDDVVERVTLALLEEPTGDPKARAQAALSALKPGDDLPNGLHVETSQFWHGVSDENNAITARQAAEEMREKCIMTMWHSLRNAMIADLEAAEAAIRALSVEPNNE